MTLEYELRAEEFKLLAGLQDSAFAWAVLLPVYWASAYYECASSAEAALTRVVP